MKVKIIPIYIEKNKELRPHSIGKRDIKELLKQMELYVKLLHSKGIKVVKVNC